MTQPLARWLAIASIAWLVLAPTALRVVMAASPSSPPWQQICTSHGEQSTPLPGAPGTPGGVGACDCPLCVLCHLGWASAPVAIQAVDILLNSVPPLVTDARSPRPAWQWAQQNPRAPPRYF
ncbi:MAG TPA: DUF2946 family protein [Rhodoferax sp.]|nr:DUF2946 family protein [Rhodoferax sp.]